MYKYMCICVRTYDFLFNMILFSDSSNISFHPIGTYANTGVKYIQTLNLYSVCGLCWN